MARTRRTKRGWLLRALFLAAALWGGFSLGHRFLPKIAIHQIGELTGTEIKTKLADFSLNGSVFIKGLVIRPQQSDGGNDLILKADTVYARFGLLSLLLFNPRLKEIDIDNFIFNVQHNLDSGQWNVAKLRLAGSRGVGGKMPLVSLSNGTLRYSKISDKQARIIMEAPLDAEFGPAKKSRDAYEFSITTAEITKRFGKSILRGLWRPGNITITGGVSSADTPGFESAWTANVLAAELNYDRQGTYSLKLRVKNLFGRDSDWPNKSDSVEPSFRQTNGGQVLEGFEPFASLQKFFSRYNPTGQADIELEASGNLQRPSESKLAGNIYCKDVAFCYQWFPYTVEHLLGQIDFTENSIILNNLRGRHGETELLISGWTKYFGADRQYQIRIVSDNMVLNKDLYEALDTEEKKYWSAFSPSGLAEVDYRISRQSPTERKKTLAVRLLGVEAAYSGFPYPLKNLEGNLVIDGNGVTARNIISQTEGKKITINGKVSSVYTQRPVYDISVKGENIPLDSALTSALPAGQKQFCEQFDKTGFADGDIKIFNPNGTSKAATYRANVFLKNASFKVKQFEPVVSDVSAKMVCEPNMVYIENLAGKYGDGEVTLSGRVWADAESRQSRYSLHLRGQHIRFNDELCSLLPASVEKFARRLNAEGRINCLAELNKKDETAFPDCRITVDCLGDSINFKDFPYPLKDITGKLTITKDSLEFKDIAATTVSDVRMTPASSTIKINGRAAIAGNASGGKFQIRADNILFDKRLGVALPAAVRGIYDKLSPTGIFNLDLEELKISDLDGARYIDFSGTVKLDNCGFAISPAVTELNGTLKMKGQYKAGDWFSGGRADFLADNVKIRGRVLTGLKANIEYDPVRKSWIAENLAANCYGGKVAGKFEISRTDSAGLDYSTQIGFDNIDLRQFLSIENPQQEHSKGKIAGSFSVAGKAGDSTSRIGRCRLRITDMQAGRPSALGKLLDVLKLTEPRDFLFEQMLVDSYIKSDTMFFKQFDLSGKSVAFNGSGRLNLKNDNIDLDLTARGHRLAGAEPSLLQSLTDGISKAIVRMDVTGNVYDPQVTTKTLPVITDSLGILGK